MRRGRSLVSPRVCLRQTNKIWSAKNSKILASVYNQPSYIASSPSLFSYVPLRSYVADSSPPVKPPTPQTPDDEKKTEIRDATLVFETVWKELEKSVGYQRMIFPKEMIWLMGAPGSGKGTNAAFILQRQGITAPPLVVSSLLDNDPKLKQVKDSGGMINDTIVTTALFEALLKEQYSIGALIDGYPRTRLQVEIVKLLYDKMDTIKRDKPKIFPRPRFRMIVLFVDEQTSVKRQLDRAISADLKNKEVQELGIGEFEEVRATDQSEKRARTRYKTFKEHFDTVITLRERFPFHLIQASGSVQDVRNQIDQQMDYQSALELDDKTFASIHHIPLAESIAVHARQNMIKRLDDYENYHTDLFHKVLKVIEMELIPDILQQPMAGSVTVRTDNSIFSKKRAVDMVLDVMCERGFRIVYDAKLDRIPERVTVDGQIICSYVTRTFFHVTFPVPTLRKQGSDITWLH